MKLHLHLFPAWSHCQQLQWQSSTGRTPVWKRGRTSPNDSDVMMIMMIMMITRTVSKNTAAKEKEKRAALESLPPMASMDSDITDTSVPPTA